MIVQGKLYVENEVRNLLAFDLLFEQGTDWSGKPSRRPQLEGVFIQIESTNNDELFHHWITTDHAMMQGKIVFYAPDGVKEQRKYEFWDCYCVNWKEGFRHNTEEPMGMSMKLMPGIFKTPGGTIAEKPWKISDPFTKSKPLSQEADKDPQVIETYWLDEEGQKRVDRATYGDKARFFVKTENMPTGEKLTITVKDEDKQAIGGKTELVYSGTVDSGGTAELEQVDIKKEWDNI